MNGIEVSKLTNDELTDVLSKAQTEMASRERTRRKDLRTELERCVSAEGYKLGDILPELAKGPTGRRKMPARYRNPENPDETWTGIGRSPKWVQAILAERGIEIAAFKSIPMYQIHS